MALFYEDVPVTKKQCVGFECNRCKVKYDANDFVEMQEMLNWQYVSGYGSVWGDGTKVEVTLCQHCTLELFGDFATVDDA